MPSVSRVSVPLVGGCVLAVAALVAGCQKSAEDELAAARQAIQAQASDQAIIHLKNALTQQPSNAAARFLLGQQYAARNEPAAAVAEFKRALELKYPLEELIEPLARSLGDTGQAAQVLVLLAPLKPATPEAQARLEVEVANAQIQLGDLPAARQAADRAMGLAPRLVESRLAKARVLTADNQFDPAQALTDTLLAEAPKRVDIRIFQGELLARSGKSDEALQAYQAALALNPNSTRALTLATGILLQKQDIQQARAMLARLKKLAPAAVTTSYYDARVQYLEGNHAAARALFQTVLNQTPESATALLASGVNELKLRAPAQAEAQLSKALRILPGSAATRYYLAQANLALSRPDVASSVLAPLLSVPTPHPAVMLLAAQARLLQGDPKGADQLFTRASKLHPKEASVRTALAMMAAARGDTDAALHELEDLASGTTGTAVDLQLISARMAKGDTAGAMEAIEALERKQPGTASAQDLRGQVLLRQGKPAEARQAFEAALKIEPKYMPSVGNLSDLDMADGHPDKARERLAALAAAEPRNASLQLALANVLQRMDKAPAEVSAAYEAAVRADPKDLRARLMLIDRMVQLNNLTRAREEAQAAMLAIPDNALIHDALARVLLQLGDRQQALSTYAKLVRVAPREPAGYLGQVKLLLAGNDLEGAGKLLQQLTALEPRNPEVRKLGMMLAVARKQPDEAMRIAREVQREQPTQAAGFALEADVQMSQQNWAAAATAYRTALSKSGGDAAAQRLHEALLRDGRRPEAAAMADQWLSAHPKDIAFMAYLAEVAYADHDLAASRRQYERLLTIAPNHAGALNNLAWLLLESKSPDALKFAQKAAERAPDHVGVLDTLAQAYAAAGEPAKGVEVLKKAINRSTDPHGLRLALARMYVAAGDKNSAIAELETLRDLGKAFPQQVDVRRMLSDLRTR